MCLAIPGELIAVDGGSALPMGRVSYDGVVKDVCLACTPDAAVGDYVLVHGGFVLSVLSKAEADAVMAELATLDRGAEAAAPRV